VNPPRRSSVTFPSAVFMGGRDKPGHDEHEKKA
jgi:hypothetical protein